MTPRMRVSKEGLALIKSFEGFRAEAALLESGHWTIGYGHTASAREGAKISESDAEALLLFDLRPIEQALNLDLFAALGQRQFDALASLALNIGLDAFLRSDVVKHLNAGEIIAAANGIEVWRRARLNGRSVVVDALVRRRAVEKAWFLEHPAGRPAAPTSVLRPEIDITGAILANRDATVDVTVPLSGTTARVIADTSAIDSRDAENLSRTPAAAAAAVVSRLSKILETSEKASLESSGAAGTATVSAEVSPSEVDERVIEALRETLSALPQPLQPDETSQVALDPVIAAHAEQGVDDNANEVGSNADLTPLDIGRLSPDPDPDVGNTKGDDILAGRYREEDLPPFDPAAHDAPANVRTPNRFVAALPYGLFGLLGAAFIALGGWQYWQLVQSGRVVGQNELLPGPFLVLVGIIGLVIGTYYFIKRLVSDDE